jgi:hypothetical protein
MLMTLRRKSAIPQVQFNTSTCVNVLNWNVCAIARRMHINSNLLKIRYVRRFCDALMVTTTKLTNSTV